MRAILKSNKLRELALRRGLRLGDVARAVGVSQVQFSKVLSGAHELRPRSRDRLCQFLAATFDDLFEVCEQ